MILILALILLALLIFGPQFYVRHVMNKYNCVHERLPGSGGELARHLLDRFELATVTVEISEHGDHYDPTARAVRLSRDNLEGRSLTAIAVAAHEVGHALQDAEGDAMFEVRSRMIRVATLAEKAGAIAMLAIPLLTLLSRSPMLGLVTLIVALTSFLSATLVHLVTLPVEWDASFGRALPILTQGEYIDKSETRAVKRILRAAALTYVAASLTSLLNLSRWLTILRR
ncbi:MAG: zinc metallopeptidase [Gammaproteobacteria bacterium]|nr:zinc metallopeptidase [Gammaproteobacteria bacterium]